MSNPIFIPDKALARPTLDLNSSRQADDLALRNRAQSRIDLGIDTLGEELNMSIIKNELTARRMQA